MRAGKKNPTKRRKTVKAASSQAGRPSGASLTLKGLQDALGLVVKNSGAAPDMLLMDSDQMDAYRYMMMGMNGSLLKVGEWFIIGRNIYEVVQITSHHLVGRNVETGRGNNFDKFSKQLKKVPKGGNLDMIRTLYG